MLAGQRDWWFGDGVWWVSRSCEGGQSCALLEAELFVSLVWLFDVIFSCWLQETVPT